jgi:hypothetical protein
MKEFFLLLSLPALVSSSWAQGSSFQEICGNPDGTVLHRQGMGESETFVTVREYGATGVKDTRLYLKDPILRVLDSTHISMKEGCAPSGLYWRKYLNYKSVLLSDRSQSFPPGTVGLAPSSQGVEVDFLCQRSMSDFDGRCPTTDSSNQAP